MTDIAERQIIHDPAIWDPALAALPFAHALQSWAWGDFKSRWGWRAARLLWQAEAGPVAAAQVLQRAIPGTPWRFLYISKGPALDYGNPALVEQILADIESYARQVGALFVKIDPDVVRAYSEPSPQTSPDPSGQAVLEILARRDWLFSAEQIQFRNSVVIDLTPAEADLLAAMKSKWRYNIRLAERRGVTIRPGSAADIPYFYRMYAQTAARDGFLIRPAAYYEDVWQQFLTTGQAEMLLAEVEGVIVAGLLLFFCGPTVWYLYGASTGQHRQDMPNHLLQWQAMRRAKARGCTRYDLWGAPDVFDERDPMWGVYRFKQGFGGQIVLGLGAFDYPVNHTLYWAFTAALPRLRSFVRRLSRFPVSERITS